MPMERIPYPPNFVFRNDFQDSEDRLFFAQRGSFLKIYSIFFYLNFLFNRADLRFGNHDFGISA